MSGATLACGPAASTLVGPPQEPISDFGHFRMHFRPWVIGINNPAKDRQIPKESKENQQNPIKNDRIRQNRLI